MPDVTNDGQEDVVVRLLQEIEAGNGLTLSAIARSIPAHRGAGRTNPATVFRWINSGVKDATGQLVKLEAIRLGARWLSSREAVARFVTALTPTGCTPVVRPRTPSQARHAAAVAGRRLQQRGA
jgi:hypothetical protein